MKMITVGFCAIVIMLGLTSILNINATNEVEQAVKDTRPTVAVETPVNVVVENNNDELVATLKEELQTIKKEIQEQEETKDEEESQEQVLVGVNQNGVVYQAQPTKEVWRGPKNYKCNMAAGYPAECGYCGEVGEIHFNIKEWQDEQGTYHLTHVGCGQKYCDKVGVQPRIEESYKIR